ncbi:MAG: RHS repeat-associated core domain-containing protein [Candidatus Omnitrophica bacterium]|nr:RHS repeat-associated core domain-containing protein [Candidatus Omnitrophota bacterium]
MSRGGATYYFAWDQVGTLRAVYNASGALVKRVESDSFGNILTDTAPTFTVPFGFAGGLRDTDTGLVHFGYRDYDPATGRWTAKDPIGFNGGALNLYGYCLEDPVNFTDPLGLAGFPTAPCAYPPLDSLPGDVTFSQPSHLYDGALDYLGQSLAATADGFIPFIDPFQQLYDSNDPMLQISKSLGEFAGDLLGLALGLRGLAVAGGTRLGHWLNHNRFLRIGPGRMPRNGPHPPGHNVPRISIGGTGGPHFDLR